MHELPESCKSGRANNESKTMNTTQKIGCLECRWTGLVSELRTAVNPFDPTTEIAACPKCLAVEKFVRICDECDRPATCCTATPDGYGSTCDKHRPKESAAESPDEGEVMSDQKQTIEVPSHIAAVVRDFIAGHEAGRQPLLLIGCVLPNPLSDEETLAFFNFETRQWEIHGGLHPKEATSCEA